METEQCKSTRKLVTGSSKNVIIIGAGGHGRVIADIIMRSGDVVLGYLDDKDTEEFPGLPVIGKISDVLAFKDKALFIVGIGDNATRKHLMESLDLSWYTATHPSAVIAPDVGIGVGTAIMANVVINTGSTIGRGVILNTSATIDHDNVIADYVHISPGAHLGGAVSVGTQTWIGIGSTISNNIVICDKCIIGAGSLVIRDINEKGRYMGHPIKIQSKGIGNNG